MKIINNLPDEICRHIYSFLLDLRPIPLLREKYIHGDYDDFRYYYEKRFVIHNSYFWTHHCIFFTSIVSCYLFDIEKTDIYESEIVDMTEQIIEPAFDEWNGMISDDEEHE